LDSFGDKRKKGVSLGLNGSDVRTRGGARLPVSRASSPSASGGGEQRIARIGRDLRTVEHPQDCRRLSRRDCVPTSDGFMVIGIGAARLGAANRATAQGRSRDAVVAGGVRGGASGWGFGLGVADLSPQGDVNHRGPASSSRCVGPASTDSPFDFVAARGREPADSGRDGVLRSWTSREHRTFEN
jgi:hypothetical protein